MASGFVKAAGGLPAETKALLTPENLRQGVKIQGGGLDVTGSFTADATAAEAQILTGQTAYVQGQKVTGNMPDNGAVSQTLPVNGSYTIPAGYHNGGGRVTQNIPARGAATITPGTGNQTIPAGVYLSGVQTIVGSGNLAPGNIRRGVNIFGVVGSAKMHSFVPPQSKPDWTVYKVELASVYSGYRSLTMDDIAFGMEWANATLGYSDLYVVGASYNPSTGTLTINIDGSYKNMTARWRVYLYY